MDNLDSSFDISAAARKNLIEPLFLKDRFLEDKASDWNEWFKIMDEAVPKDEDLLDLAQSYFEDAVLSEQKKNVEQTVNNLSLVIRISPSGTSLIIRALIKRGVLLMEMGHFKSAITDFYFALLQFQNNTDIHLNCDYFENLKKCLLALRDETAAQNILFKFQKSIKELKTLNEKTKSNYKDVFDKFVFTIKNEVVTSVVNEPNEYKGDTKYIPFMGYTTLYPKIKQFSVACSLM